MKVLGAEEELVVGTKSGAANAPAMASVMAVAALVFFFMAEIIPFFGLACAADFSGAQRCASLQGAATVFVSHVPNGVQYELDFRTAV